MYQSILVPTDGSPPAEVAAAYGVELAATFGAELHALTVTEPDRDGDPAFEPIRERATQRDLSVEETTITQRGDVHRAILDHASQEDIDLIVMGTHGRSGLDRFVLGSVAEQTLRDAPMPVATVHDQTNLRPDLEQLLVPTDGSAGARSAVEHASELAAATGARLHLLHVTGARAGASLEAETVDPSEPVPTGQEAIDDVLKLVDLEAVTVSAVPGDTHQTILAVAADHDVDAIVMGTHGRTGLRRYLLGSATERVVRFATVPVIATTTTARETVTVEYLTHSAIEDQGWSIDDPDLFAQAARAELDRDSYGTISVATDDYLLDAAESAGLDWPYQCRAGGCVNCAAVVKDGDVTMDVNRSLDDEDLEAGLRLTCTGQPVENLQLVVGAKDLERLADRSI